MRFFKLGFILLILGVFISCSSDNEAIVSLEEEEVVVPEEGEEIEVADATLNAKELQFLAEYEYVTFNLAPDSFGATVNEKWNTDIKIFLDGSITDDYRSEIEEALLEFNVLFDTSITAEVVSTFEESNVHLIFGNKSAIEEIWPDMFNAIGQINFQGYALFQNNNNYEITQGRIWVRNSSIPLFNHELGHIIGLGHASTGYCSGDIQFNESFMCSFLRSDFSVFDKGLIKMLYHPKIEVGKTYSQLKPMLEELLLTDKILIE